MKHDYRDYLYDNIFRWGQKLQEITISDKIHLRDNNFDFLRFFAASLVILTHSYGLTGIKGEPFIWLSGYDSAGRLAVNIFFIISGFLITKSWIDKPVLSAFVKKRILRIFPGLFFAVLFSALIIGPLVTTISLGEYFLNPHTINHLKAIILLPIGHMWDDSILPGVFADNYVPYIVNGSLWTLQAEMVMYISVIFFGLLGLYKRPGIVFLIFMATFCIQLFVIPNFIPDLLTWTKLGLFFLLGSIIYLFKDKVILNSKLALLVFIIWILSFHTSLAILVNYLALPYLIIYFAFENIPYIKNFTKHGDFSYGMYIYAYPIQQTILFFYAKNINLWLFFLTAFLITLLLAFLSWKYIEKPFLKLKKKSYE